MRGARDFLRGLWALPRGARFLLAHRSLWAAALAPLGINIACFAFAFYLAFAYAREFVGRLLPEGSWYWLALEYLGVLLALSVSLAAGIVMFLIAASILASPFNDWLGAKTLAALGHRSLQPAGSVASMLRSSLRTVKESLKEAGYFLAVSAALFVLGFIPIVGLAAPLLTALFFCYSLTFSAVMPCLSERELTFREKRAVLRYNRWASFGFGLACLLMLAIPLAGFFFFPVAIVGGALLYSEVLSTNEER